MDKVLAQSISESVKDAVQPKGSLITKVKQATGVYVDTIIYNNLNQIREIDFTQKLGAPASFMRIVATQTSQMDFKNWSEKHDQKITEWKTDPEGLTALIIRRYHDENLEMIRILPTAYPCTVRIWASKKGTQKDFLE